nr:organomercurial lyase MerB [Pseudonocardia spinosispora]
MGRTCDSWVWRPLLTLLVAGRPVTVDDLAAATVRSVEEVADELDRLGDTEYNRAGMIVGHGITLIPTPHRVEIDGNQLFTWCAWDTLFFPVLLGRRAQVVSPCKVTGTPIRLTVQPDRITTLEPATAMMSLVAPDNPTSLRASFCSRIHFFVTHELAAGWLVENPDATILPVVNAFLLGQAMFGGVDSAKAPNSIGPVRGKPMS